MPQLAAVPVFGHLITRVVRRMLIKLGIDYEELQKIFKQLSNPFTQRFQRIRSLV